VVAGLMTGADGHTGQSLHVGQSLQVGHAVLAGFFFNSRANQIIIAQRPTTKTPNNPIIIALLLLEGGILSGVVDICSGCTICIGGG
jgi:hypothetical protein